MFKSSRELLQKGSRKRRPKTQYFIRLSYGPKCYVNRPYRKRGLTIELHFSVAGYGGLHLPFSGITQYLRGLVSVYERPIIAGVRILIVSSTYAKSLCIQNFAIRICACLLTVVCSIIRESVDSLCRIGADAQYMQYLSKSRITSPQTRKKLV